MTQAEQANSVCGGANDGLPLEAEAGAEKSREPRKAVILPQDSVQTRVVLPANDLGASRSVDVNHSRAMIPHPIRARERHGHEARSPFRPLAAVEALIRVFLEHDGPKG